MKTKHTAEQRRQWREAKQRRRERLRVAQRRNVRQMVRQMVNPLGAEIMHNASVRGAAVIDRAVADIVSRIDPFAPNQLVDPKYGMPFAVRVDPIVARFEREAAEIVKRFHRELRAVKIGA